MTGAFNMSYHRCNQWVSSQVHSVGGHHRCTQWVSPQVHSVGVITGAFSGCHHRCIQSGLSQIHSMLVITGAFNGTHHWCFQWVVITGAFSGRQNSCIQWLSSQVELNGGVLQISFTRAQNKEIASCIIQSQDGFMTYI